MSVALCDFEGYIIENGENRKSGKNQPRLKSRSGNYNMELIKAQKLIGNVKLKRPDMLLVGFKTTSNVFENEIIKLAQNLCNETNCDFVFANDIHKRINVIVGKNNYTSNFYKNRNKAISFLVELVGKTS